MTQENSNLPEPVRRQLELANKLAAEQFGDGAPPATPAAAVVEPVVAPVVEPVTPEPAAVVEPVTPAVVQPAVIEPAVKAADDDYKARYLTLQGKYDREVPALQAELKAVNKQVDSLLTLLETTGEAAKTAPAAAPAAAPTAYVTPEDRAQFGDDMVDMVNRAAKQMLVDLGVNPEKLQSLVAETGRVKETVSAIATHIQQSDEEAMHQYLRRVLPEYEAVDADPEFGEWLRKLDPVFGVSRAEAYQEAALRQFDGPRVEGIMRRFAAETNKVFRSSQAEPVVTTPKVDPRDALATPVRTTAAPPPAQQKKVWKAAEITQFYREVRERKYSPEKMAAIEAEIFEAQREGRVER